MKRILYLCIATSIVVTAGCSFDTSQPDTSHSKQQIEHASKKEARQTYLQKQLQEANAFIQDSTIRANKYNKMMESPFNFYRGTTPLYYSDLRTGVIPIPAGWNQHPPIQTWLEGDAHAQNVAIFDDREGALRFDVTDFKNSYIGPFYWDILRFMSSIFLFTDELPHIKVSKAQQKQLASTFLQTYQTTLQNIIENPTEKYKELRHEQLKNGLIQKQMEKMKLSYTYEAFLEKTTLLQNGKHIFLPNDPSFVPLRTEEQEDFTKGWNEYIKSIASFADKKTEGYFTRKDVVHKQNSGVGSVGRDIFYVLLEGDTAGPADDIVLEVKEQQLPAMFAEGQLSKEEYNRWFTSHAERTRIATLATGMKVDSYLGTLYTQGRSYSVKKLSPWYHEFESADFRKISDVEEFVQYAAKAFARMHARADLDYNPAYVPHHFAENALVFMKQNPKFSQQLLQWSETYYHQVIEDYTLFQGLIQSKKL
ncbi:TPA: DUF2252 family protein [Bacillus cereus]|uniref:DUF2252 family protein n=1 Tax=Bacillus wiedmannii TaxID=1890302 RepID=UPI0018CD129A|nr:DUF2252 family protein [Bacillus wiedmannii]MBG9829649.1 hypothetical protein [Bacillus wiedmannii]UOB98764.1 hypothetical protein BTI679_61650 [Bacillus wiedmannii]